MKKLAALLAYARFVKTATAAGKLLDSGKGSDLPPELRGAGVGALAGGIPSAALGAFMGRAGGGGSELKNRLLMSAILGGLGATGGGLLGAGAGAIGRAATAPEDEDRLTGGSPVARGALLGGAGLGGVTGGLGAGFGAMLASMDGGALVTKLRHAKDPAAKAAIRRAAHLRELKGALSGGIPGLLAGGALGAGLGAGAGALRKAFSKKEQED